MRLGGENRIRLRFGLVLENGPEEGLDFCRFANSRDHSCGFVHVTSSFERGAHHADKSQREERSHRWSLLIRQRINAECDDLSQRPHCLLAEFRHACGGDELLVAIARLTINEMPP
jgi:hypothetical protein